MDQLSGAAIAKRLASCNQPARSRAVRLLTRWLPLQSSSSAAAAAPFSDSDLIKIWKGLFYCVWHADKLPFQLDLINRLSSLLETLDADLSIRYFESFLVTIRREWSGIDHLRLDKFYLLIRKFINRFFALLKKNDWDVDLLDRLVRILSEKSLLAADKFEASGVNYHIAEVFLDEIEGFLPVKPETLDSLLRPFVSVLERSSNRVLVNKILANVFEKLAQNGAKYLSGERSGEAEKFGKYAFVLGFSEKFFKSASDEGTVQGNRKVLFGLHDRFLKLEKDLEKSGLEISFEDSGNGNEVEKVESLGVENSDEDDGSDARPVRKRKKEKKASDGVVKMSKAKKKRNVLSDSVVDSNGSIDAAVDGENGIESNGTASKSGTRKKKKKNNLKDSAVESNDKISDLAAEENTVNGDVVGDDELLDFDETLISNLQKQFEKVAAEAGMALPVTPIAAAKKKRRRAKSADKLATVSNADSNGESIAASIGEKSVKKVRFSMKNNLVWKPQTPLPPQSLRVPPSATPRGSALKKGVPPGPIKETPPTVKKMKAMGSSVKKARKSLKSVSPAVKRLRKLQTLSA